MELDVFFKKYANDYEDARNCLVQLERIKNDKYIDFINRIFPKALRNFADKICKEQRENCAKKYTQESLLLESAPVFADDITFAEQPKIEEL